MQARDVKINVRSHAPWQRMTFKPRKVFARSRGSSEIAMGPTLDALRTCYVKITTVNMHRSILNAVACIMVPE